jgi:hypothetical protein
MFVGFQSLGLPRKLEQNRNPGTSQKFWNLGTLSAVGLESWSFLPSGYVKIAIEDGPVEIVDLPINSMVDLSSSLC